MAKMTYVLARRVTQPRAWAQGRGGLIMQMVEVGKSRGRLCLMKALYLTYMCSKI